MTSAFRQKLTFPRVIPGLASRLFRLPRSLCFLAACLWASSASFLPQILIYKHAYRDERAPRGEDPPVPKIVILSNQAASMANFWRVLIASLRENDFEITCFAPVGDEGAGKLEKLGASIEYYPLDRKGLNPFKDARTYISLKKLFKKIKPDFLFVTTIKPVIYGCVAAGASGVPCVFAAITGLGYAFEADSPLKKALNIVVQLLYRYSLKRASGVFFQNRDDLELFRSRKILSPNANVFIVPGTGVDTERFAPAPLPAVKEGPKFLVIARLLEAKGLWEYFEATKILKKKYPGATFSILGQEERGPGSIPVAVVKEWANDGVIYEGATEDARPYIQASDVVVLPSWREGLPTVLMEAAAMGRPIIAADAPGSREIVRNSVNGFLCEVKNPVSLATAMERFILEPELIAPMGKKGREIVEKEFDAKKVAAFLIDAMRRSCGKASGLNTATDE
ncbi:MAG: glycosyltransferase family 4 protein [Desulfovibrio sp.]|nr:glycosyltransferase family 4 protein [Desulfovibrio sp.]